MNFNRSTLKKSNLIVVSVGVAALFGTSSVVLAAQDTNEAKAAQALVKDSNCLKCHAVKRKKNGPSFKEIAAREQGKANAEDVLVNYLKSHGSLKSNDEPAVRGVARYILSR